MDPAETFVAAAAQSTPVFMDRKATLAKTCDLIAEASRNEARLIVFPEAYLPAYPDWVWLIPGNDHAQLNRLYIELVQNSVSIPDETTVALCKMAKEFKINLVMGINERNIEASQASLYNSLLYIDDLGNILGKHRKLVPTSSERTVWSQGDAGTLQIYKTSVGVIGGLICWENYMPLARTALYGWGVQIYLAPTWDYGSSWITTLQFIAKEGGVFVIGCGMPFRLQDVPERFEFKQLYSKRIEWINPGNSCIVAPGGKILAGPLKEREEILYAEIDPTQILAAKRTLDVTGHYARPDVFNFNVNHAPVQADQ